MKLTVAQNAFYQCLQRMVSVIPAKTTIPILTNILFELRGNQLQLTGTDLEVSIVTTLEVTGETDGVAAFPAKRLFDLIRELPETPITMESDDSHRLVIKTDKGQYKISGVASDDYPHIATEERTVLLDCQASRFTQMVEKAMFAVSTDELRSTLMGVLVELRPQELRVVSTDGHRLAKSVDHKFDYAGDPTQVIIPVKAFHLLTRNIEQAENMQFGIGPDHVTFRLGPTAIYSKVISGMYPNYEKVIPVSNEFEMTVERDILAAAVRRSMIFASQHTRQIKWRLGPNVLTMLAENADIGGNSEEQIPVEYDGDEMEIGYNAAYILDVLRNLDSERALFKLQDAGSAAVIEPVTKQEDLHLMMLLMPIRLND